MNRNHYHPSNKNTNKFHARAEITERRRLREKKKNSRRLCCLTFLMVSAAVISIFIASAANATKISETKSYIVSSGDTLWNIARECNTESRDLRAVMDDIMKLNGMTGAKINIGEELTLPVY